MSAALSSTILPQAIVEAEAAFAPPHIERFVAERGVWAVVIRMPVDMPTTAAAAQALGISQAQIVKTLIFTAGDEVFAVIAPGDTRINKLKLAALLGVGRVAMAPTAEVVACTGCLPGGVAPIGFLKPLKVVVDRQLMDLDFVVGGGGREDLLMCISPRELVFHNQAILATIAERVEP